MKGALLRCERLGDMEARYWLSEEGVVSLRVDPAGWESRQQEKREAADSLVQLRLRGDDFPFGFANGHTLRNGASVYRFKYQGQTCLRDGQGTRIETCLASPEGYVLKHSLVYRPGGQALEVRTAFENRGEAPVTLEMLSSFSLCGLTPYARGDAVGALVLHRLRSKWSSEGRLCSEAIEDLQLEPSWSGHGACSERFGQVGSMPVRRFFPFAAVEDRQNGVLWGARLHVPASWQIEVYRRDDGLCLSGGLADFDFGHWARTVRPGETFEAPPALVTACAGSLDGLCDRLTRAQRASPSALPRLERLPVVFNEFCATWGVPSQRRVEAMLAALKGRDVDCFVIDAGWYAQPGRSWEMNMGDWQVNRSLFPEGLGAAARAIRAAGMRPGLWFEPEICGRDADAFSQAAHQLRRCGAPVTAGVRRFWDMRDPWVRAYLRDRIIGLLAQCGFEYVKFDFNESVGVGCDGAESLGEGLRQNAEAALDFYREVRARIPGIWVECCASGGHRLAPSFLEICQLASATDAHEERELPIIAANLHRVMLPEQSLIWAVLRSDDSPRRLVWSIAATFLGVMCLSGDIETLTPAQWAIVEGGIAFYRRAEPVIRDGVTVRHGPEIASYRHPDGWQAVERTARDGGKKLVVIHAFARAPERIRIPVGEGFVLSGIFAERPGDVCLSDGELVAAPGEDGACAVLLERTDGQCPASGR